MNLMDKRKQQPFYLTSRGTVYKPSDKSLLKAVVIVVGFFLLGVAAFVAYMLGVRF